HLRVPAGIVRVARAGDEVRVTADPDWGPEFTWQEHPTADALRGLVAHAVDPWVDHLYAWAWTDEAAGEVRARMFAPALGVPEDEATGSAALRL
ncbi:PhzF family phenazine biosynthesis protein, partial [Clavibacter michiganensis subsp. insidiosus]